MSIIRNNILEANNCFKVIYDQLTETLNSASLDCELNDAVHKINQPSLLSKRESISVFINWIIGVLESEKKSTTTSKIVLSKAGQGLATGELYNKKNLPIETAKAQHKNKQIDYTVNQLNDIKKEANTFSAWTTLQECLNKLIIFFKSFSRSKSKETFQQPKKALLKTLDNHGLFKTAERSTQQSADHQSQAPAAA